MTDKNHEADNPAMFDTLAKEDQDHVVAWIKDNLEPATGSYVDTSYGLKHAYANLTNEPGNDRYLLNGQFKGAMLAAGFKPIVESEQNWHFRAKWRKGKNPYKNGIWVGQKAA